MSSRPKRRQANSFEPPTLPMRRLRSSRSTSRMTKPSSSILEPSLTQTSKPSLTQQSFSFKLAFKDRERPSIAPRNEESPADDDIDMPDNNYFYFVIPEGKTESGVSAFQREAYEGCLAHDYPCYWVKEEEVQNVSFENGSMFVFESFECTGFTIMERKFLKEKKRQIEKEPPFMIIGPQVLRYLFQRDVQQFFHSEFPIFTLAFFDVTISTTGIREPKQKNEIGRLVRKMGGFFDDRYTVNVTHLIANSVISEKSITAKSMKLPVMKSDWVYRVWEQSLTELVHATDSTFAIYECPMFYNLSICFSQLNTSQRAKLGRAIEANGGVYSAELDRKKSNMLVLNKGEGLKFLHAKEWNIPCVKPDWIFGSVKVGHAILIKDYLVHGSDHPFSSTLVGSEIKVPDLAGCSFIPHTSASIIDFTMASNTMIDSTLMCANRQERKSAVVLHRFLDGCRVYLSGEVNEDVEQAKKLLNNSGALILDVLSVRVTHIVVLDGRIAKNDLAILDRLKLVPHIVGLDWLKESVSKKSQADEHLFKFVFVQEENTIMAGNNVDIEDWGTLLTPQEVNAEPESKGSSSKEVETTVVRFEDDSPINPTTPTPPISVFTGKKFFLSFGNDPVGLQRTNEMVESLKGFVVEDRRSSDFVVSAPVHNDPGISEGPHFTEFWLIDCDEMSSVDIPILFYHIPVLKIEGISQLMAGVVCAISSYNSSEKGYVSALASCMGAIIQDVFAKKKVKNVVLATTHLISCFTETDKYKAAIRWNIPVVTCDWIIKCYQTRRLMETGPFSPAIEKEQSITLVTEMAATPCPEKVSSRIGISVNGPPPHSFHSDISINPIVEQLEGQVSTTVVELPMPSSEDGPSCTPEGNRQYPVNRALANVRKLSLGSYGIGSPLTQGEQPDSPIEHFNRNFLDESLCYSPSELAKMFSFPPLPSPDTPKIHAEWLAHIRERCKNDLAAEYEDMDTDTNEGENPTETPEVVEMPLTPRTAALNAIVENETLASRAMINQFHRENSEFWSGLNTE